MLNRRRANLVHLLETVGAVAAEVVGAAQVVAEMSGEWIILGIFVCFNVRLYFREL